MILTTSGLVYRLRHIVKRVAVVHIVTQDYTLSMVRITAHTAMIMSHRLVSFTKRPKEINVLW